MHACFSFSTALKFIVLRYQNKEGFWTHFPSLKACEFTCHTLAHGKQSTRHKNELFLVPSVLRRSWSVVAVTAQRTGEKEPGYIPLPTDAWCPTAAVRPPHKAVESETTHPTSTKWRYVQRTDRTVVVHCYSLCSYYSNTFVSDVSPLCFKVSDNLVLKEFDENCLHVFWDLLIAYFGMFENLNIVKICILLFQGGCISKLEEFILQHLIILGSVGLGIAFIQVSNTD